MCILARPHRRWTRTTLVVGTFVAGALTAATLRAQTSDPPVQIVDVKRSTIAQEVARLAQAGDDIVFARLDPGLLIAQPSVDPGPRAYLFVDDLPTFLAGKSLAPGYRLLPQSLSPGGKPHCAIFEKREGDDRPREYAFVKGSSPGDLEKKARQSLLAEFVPVAINTEGDAIAVFERLAEATPWKLLATTSTKTMEKELAAAALEGLHVVAAAGGGQLTYALVERVGAPDYRLLSTTRAVTLERELNDAAASGFRFVPGSLASLKGGSILRASNEVAIVVQKSAEPAATYRIVGARRVATIGKEINEPASRGFTVVAGLIGYEETVVILAMPRDTRTVR